MAHTLSLTDGTTTLVLADGVATPSIGLISFTPPRPRAIRDRVDRHPFSDGTLTTGPSTVGDVEAEIICCIFGTSADNVDSQLASLTRLLRAATLYEEQRIGSPVRLVWKRQGETNTAYWVITGVDMPEPTGADHWLDEDTYTNRLELRIGLLLEPVPHAGAVTTIKATTALTNVPASNYTTMTATTGTLDGPTALKLTKTIAGNNWTHILMAYLGGVPDVHDYSGTADAAAYGAAGLGISATGTAAVTAAMANVTIAAKHQYPLRGVLRLKPTSGTPGKLRVRMVLYVGAAGVALAGPWVTCGATLNSYYLMDLGSLPSLTHIAKRYYQVSATYHVEIEYQTTDASTVAARLDYLELLPFLGFTSLSVTTIGNANSAIYEDVALDGSFAWPRPMTQTYRGSSTTTLSEAITPRGRLGRLPPNQAVTYWAAWQTATLHDIADTASIEVKHLPTYNLGLRGAG